MVGVVDLVVRPPVGELTRFRRVGAVDAPPRLQWDISCLYRWVRCVVPVFTVSIVVARVKGTKVNNGSQRMTNVNVNIITVMVRRSVIRTR